MIARRRKFFRILGVDVSVDLSWLPLGLLLVWVLAETVFPFLVPGLSTPAYWAMAVAGTIGWLASIIGRTLVRILAARWLRMELHGLTLQVFGEVAEGPLPARARREALAAAAGAVASLLIGGILLLLLFKMADAATPLAVSGVVFGLGVANAALMLFDLLPADLLSGGRVLRIVLCRRQGARRARRITAGAGCLLGGVLVLLGIWLALRGIFLGGAWVALVGLLLLIDAATSYRRTRRGRSG